MNFAVRYKLRYTISKHDRFLHFYWDKIATMEVEDGMRYYFDDLTKGFKSIFIANEFDKFATLAGSE